ncbi:MAG: class I SAM-dependent RNA methyltransferase [Alphaproteobacteria bacterium]|nr:class I SAM-dependent RNA methyltransferase [Alphaproteobacteria bacterium]
MEPRFTLFVVAAPGVEHVVAEEVEELADRPVEAVPGGVRLKGTLVDAAGLVLWCRTGGRVLVELGEVPAASLQELRARARALPWSQVLHPGQPFTVKATLRDARYKRADAAAENVQRAIQDATRGRHHRGRLPQVEVRARVAGRTATLSVDAGGGLLHRRGYRKATAKAPLRENLAAAILRAAGWRPGVPLVDPMCGSGTFSIEAALWAADRAPGLERRPPIVDAPAFPGSAWGALLQEAKRSIRPVEGVFLASDRDRGALTAARSNAERAEVAAAITFAQRAVTDPIPSPPTGPGLVVLNPPYGKRVAENVRLAGLYHAAGRALAAQLPGWRVAALSPDRALAGRLVPGGEPLLEFSNGGIPVLLQVGELKP